MTNSGSPGRFRGRRVGAVVVAAGLTVGLGACNGGGGDEDTLRIAVEIGHSLGEPIKPYVEEWEQQTGSEVEFTEIPFSEIFPRPRSTSRSPPG